MFPLEALTTFKCLVTFEENPKESAASDRKVGSPMEVLVHTTCCLKSENSHWEQKKVNPIQCKSEDTYEEHFTLLASFIYFASF